MNKIGITGAAGNVGKLVSEALSEYELTRITERGENQGGDIEIDIRNKDALVDALNGLDTLVHLAADSSPWTTWERAYEVNIGGTYNVFQAAKENGLNRVVFASTNHVQQMYNTTDPSNPVTVEPTPQALDTDMPPRPNSFYAISKITGEAIGSYYAHRFGMEVINFRIGWLLSESELMELQEKPEDEARYARAIWLSHRDCKHAFVCAIEAPLSDNYNVLNLTSENFERYYPLTQTMRTIGYHPTGDSIEVVDNDIR